MDFQRYNDGVGLIAQTRFQPQFRLVRSAENITCNGKSLSISKAISFAYLQNAPFAEQSSKRFSTLPTTRR